MLETVETKVTR